MVSQFQSFDSWKPAQTGPVSMPRTGLAVFAEVLRGLFSEVRIAKQRLSNGKNNAFAS